MNFLKQLLMLITSFTLTGNILASSISDSSGLLDIHTMVKEADFIFEGVVKSVRYYQSEANQNQTESWPYTFVTYQIQKVLKGNTSNETLTLRFLGGREDEFTFMMISGYPLFDLGDHDLLMVNNNTQSACPLVSCAKGRFRLIEGMVLNESGRTLELTESGLLNFGHVIDSEEVNTHLALGVSLERHQSSPEGEELNKLSNVPSTTSLTSSNFLIYLDKIIQKVVGDDDAIASPEITSANIEELLLTPLIEPSTPPEEDDKFTETSKAETAQEQYELEMIIKNNGNPVIK